MSPVIISNAMTSIMTDGIIMESSHIATLQIPGIIKQAGHIHIYPKIKKSPLISLGVLCDYGCIITLEKQDKPV